ncbi:PKD domain-containing protein [Kitasatospora herbaricolor]|uniref:PKD domain-containing protein n=1 Tax=Kitasatospora herbaricolor TaxID=68217 RepID=UPI0036D8442E
MHRRHLAGLATATVISLGAGLPAPSVAVAADGDTLYVNRIAGCSDSGTGTKAAPFCSLQAAADRALPGQTVQAEAGVYFDPLVVTHSGSPGKPITFLGTDMRRDGYQMPGIGFLVNSDADENAPGLRLDGVHDIRISGFKIIGDSQESVLVNDSDRVTVDGNLVLGGPWTDPRPASLRVTGGADATVVSRNWFLGFATKSVTVDKGATGTVVTTNVIPGDGRAVIGGIQVTDAPGTVVTSNSVRTCDTAVSVLGASPGSVVKNNILAKFAPCADHVLAARLAVSAESAASVSEGYNSLSPAEGEPAYAWAGAVHPDSVSFAKAVSGRGDHDLTTRLNFYDRLLSPSDNSLIDSADPTAPGQLDIDLHGYRRIDDPDVADTGAGSSHQDRGAIENTTSSTLLQVRASPTAVPLGTPVTFTVDTPQTWSPVVSYTFDFQDGSPVVVSSAPSVTHLYPKTGEYTPVVTARLQNGDMPVVWSDVLRVSPDGPLVPTLSLVPNGNLSYKATWNFTSPWPLVEHSLDFGDGTVNPYYPLATEHVYAREGDYTVTYTVKDAGGRTAKATQQLHVGYRPSTYHPVNPTRVLDTRPDWSTLLIGQTRKVELSGHGFSFGAGSTAVVLNVTAIPRGGDGHLTVFPSDTAQPSTSNLNFVDGVTTSNLVTVPVGPRGTVDIANSHSALVDVVVDVVGYYAAELTSGDRFSPLPPARLLDTRTTAPIGADRSTSVQVAGVNGVPADATAVAVNLTGTGATEETYLAVYPSGSARSASSSLNPRPGRDSSNQVIVPVGPDGRINVYNHAGSTHAILDVSGYYGPGGQNLFTPAAPKRLLDTRATAGRLGPDGTLPLTIGGANGVPADAAAAALNVTVTDPTADSFVTVYPGGSTRPNTSSVNFQARSTVPNHVITPLAGNGTADIYNHVGSTQVIADLFGYFSKG